MHKLFGSQTEFCADKFACGRIDIARTSAHNKTFKRRKTHGSIHAFAVFDCGNRRTVAEVANDDFAVFFAEKFDCFFTDKLVRSAVETVLSDFVLVVHGIRNTVHIRFCRHRAVERGVEHRNHRHTGHNFSAALYAGDVAGHMERAEFRILFANADDFVVDDDGGLEVLAAVEHSVSYRADFVR